MFRSEDIYIEVKVICRELFRFFYFGFSIFGVVGSCIYVLCVRGWRGGFFIVDV